MNFGGRVCSDELTYKRSYEFIRETTGTEDRSPKMNHV